LVDFGFSCKTIDKSNQRIKINSNIPVGSPGYNTPEQMHKETYYADDADLFAAGCVLFQMVINSSPFTNTQNQGKILKTIL
jgi:serine/threonine protein kinase